ncbi:site-specific integrase [Tepidanaerobacter acetatoxydans]|uniref:site-specific integrase n=1 Tax=Tepidanaerobacter acetatoxydans TaxID=499229 RepID=UPI001BD28668|nr:site-specific integrase [Tepidanaerobacter acetatoxydans]
MKTVSPIRDKRQIELVKMYLKNRNLRDYLMFIMGINCNLRIGDLLQLKVSDVWNGRKCKEYIELTEQKTGKFKKVKINESMEKAIKEYMKEVKPKDTDYLFKSAKDEKKPISRQQAHYILRQAGDYCGLEEPLAPHSLRKTWGYWAWKNGASLVLIMEALNHSSISITKRYLGITQEDIDNVYINLNL